VNAKKRGKGQKEKGDGTENERGGVDSATSNAFYQEGRRVFNLKVKGQLPEDGEDFLGKREEGRGN